jgi:hypothetical protein
MASALQLDLFNSDRLPRKPYCSDDLAVGLRIRSLRAALNCKYIQMNPPRLRMWMIQDIDHPGAALAWEDANLPAPAWTAVTPENTHGHSAWGLSAPVLTGDGSRDGPLRYLCAIEAAYRAALDADPGYTGLITKNPLHSRWRVLVGPMVLYELADLAEYVDLSKHVLKRGTNAEEIGLGRNCALFDWLRKWSYVAVRQYRENRNFVLWQKDCYDHALERNGEFHIPLLSQECWHVAKSVAKWTWSKDAAARAAFVERQRAKGKKGGVVSGKVRLAASEDKRTSARLMRAQGQSIREIAASLGVSVGTVHAWCSGVQ